MVLSRVKTGHTIDKSGIPGTGSCGTDSRKLKSERKGMPCFMN